MDKPGYNWNFDPRGYLFENIKGNTDGRLITTTRTICMTVNTFIDNICDQEVEMSVMTFTNKDIKTNVVIIDGTVFKWTFTMDPHTFSIQGKTGCMTRYMRCTDDVDVNNISTVDRLVGEYWKSLRIVHNNGDVLLHNKGDNDHDVYSHIGDIRGQYSKSPKKYIWPTEKYAVPPQLSYIR